MPASPKVPTVTDWPIGEGLLISLSEDRQTAIIHVDMTGNLGRTGPADKPGKNIAVAKTVGGAVDLPAMPGWKCQVMLYRLPTSEESASMRTPS
jgi:hypothetical protein